MFKSFKLLALYRPSPQMSEALRAADITVECRMGILEGVSKIENPPFDTIIVSDRMLKKALPAFLPDEGRCSLVFFEGGTCGIINYRLPVQGAEDLITDYRFQDVCAAEFLAREKVPEGMTFEQAFELYVEVMKTVEGDRFTVTKENETVEL